MTSEVILALAAPMLYATFGLAFAGLWLRDRSKSWLGIIATYYGSATIGFCIFHFVPQPDHVLAASAMHVCYSISATTLVWGIAKRAGQSFDLRLYLFIAATSLALMIGASYGEDYNSRLYAANATYGLMMALGCQAAARKPEKDLLDKAILILVAMGVFQFFTRPFVAIIVEGSMTAEQYRETLFYAIMVIWLTVSSLLLAMALLIAALTDQMKAQRKNAQRDPLTGLPMRGPFEEESIALLDRSREEDVPVSLVVADLDHFKAVNDTFGHQIGDHAIAAFGRVIADQIRGADFAGRIGGEEFCIVLWNCNARAAEAMANRVRRALTDVQVQGMPDHMRLTASFGVAQQRGSESYGKIFARADAALYEAKSSGRDCVRVDGKADNVASIGVATVGEMAQG